MEKEKNLKIAIFLLFAYAVILAFSNLLDIRRTGFDLGNARGLVRIVACLGFGMAALRGAILAKKVLLWGALVLGSLSILSAVLFVINPLSLEAVTQNHQYPALGKTLLISSIVIGILFPTFMLLHKFRSQ